ncbi:hypothetical protein [Govanella unica]|uniref:Uncharacterized protein n=1 Tax=Govanella unica TaxID=2975056 RepID=A0A9X3Z650_9PROT|nr:hypothetical protein [Govania unica]MDA5192722.1 hypothetical protein [Govania unica]
MELTLSTVKGPILALVGLVTLSGCASIIDGTSQSISVATNPPEAKCDLWRNSQLLSSMTTPNSMVIKKTKHDIDVICRKTGYHDASLHVKSEIQDATWGNIVAGGGIGWAIDSASGADNKYQEFLNITLVPVQVGETAAKLSAPSMSGKVEANKPSKAVAKEEKEAVAEPQAETPPKAEGDL